MPFEKGNQLGKTSGGGRKGYELEQEQLEKMGNILSKGLKLLEEALDSEFSVASEEKLKMCQAMLLKIMDKLHASKEKTDVNLSGENLDIVLVKFVKDGEDNSNTTGVQAPIQ